MRRFQFRLNRLLELRRYTEKQWEIKLAGVTGRCAVIRDEIRIKRGDIRRVRGVRSAASGQIDVGLLQAGDRFALRMDHEIGVLNRELAAKQEERRKVQEKYLDASKNRKVLDKLRERREREYYAEHKKEAFKTADEISLGRTARRKAKGE